MEDIADLSDEAIEELLLTMMSLSPSKFFRTQKSKKRRRRLKEDLWLTTTYMKLTFWLIVNYAC